MRITILLGVTMGGGVGISVFATHRIVHSQDFMFAMPEVNIGLYTDVGGGYSLSHYPPSCAIGQYLAMTGEKIKAFDAVYCNFASHVVPGAQFASLEQSLQSKQFTSLPHDFAALHEEVAEFLAPFRPSADTVLQYSVLDKNRFEIDDLFDANNVKQVLQNLATSKSPFAQQTLKNILKKCPTSVYVSFETVKRGKNMQSIEEVLLYDYRVATRMVTRGDFREGVRATLIDKDNKPKWQPATLEQVQEKDIAALFDEPLHKEIQFFK